MYRTNKQTDAWILAKAYSFRNIELITQEEFNKVQLWLTFPDIVDDKTQARVARWLEEEAKSRGHPVPFLCLSPLVWLSTKLEVNNFRRYARKLREEIPQPPYKIERRAGL